MWKQSRWGQSSITGALSGVPQGQNFGESVRDPREVFSNATDGDIELIVSRTDKYPKSPNGTATALKYLVTRPNGSWSSQLTLGRGDFISLEQVNFQGPQHTPRLGHSGGSVDWIYIDEALEFLTGSLFVPAFRNAINVGGSQRYYDIQIGQEMISTWHRNLTGNSKDQARSLDQLTQRIREIFRYRRLSIDASHDQQSLQIWIDDDIYRLDEVGAGLAQFIIAVFNVALRHPSMVLIDEPETNMHPNLQIQLLETLAELSGGSVMFATHNVGLARSVSDRIYSVKKDDRGHSRLRDFEHTARLSEFLGELSYSGAADQGVTGVLLVEGPTDLRVFRQLLRINKQDQSYVVLHLGGDSSINGNKDAEHQLEEIKRISGNVHAVVDSERTRLNGGLARNRREFAKLCSQAGVSCLMSERRSTENYLTPESVNSAFDEEFAPLGAYDPVPEGWPKAHNWRAARLMSKAEWDATDIGQFISKLP